LINLNAGNHFFGGGSADVSIHIVLDYKNHEWRPIGLTASIQKEFGDFLDVRENIPDSAATLVVRKSFFATAGMYSEYVIKSGKSETGVKMGWGRVIAKPYRLASNQEFTLGYLNFTVHWTYRDFTVYIQANAATKSDNVFFGINYRL
jgi:hypothetical protein